jgi:hypothetical protein
MIPAYLSETCKVGHGAACCRYVTMGADGWYCAKVDPALRPAIDLRAATMTAKGDNCPGVTNLNELANGAVSDLKDAQFMSVEK